MCQLKVGSQASVPGEAGHVLDMSSERCNPCVELATQCRKPPQTSACRGQTGQVYVRSADVVLLTKGE